MKNLTIFFTYFLTGCSKIDENSLLLVCEGIEKINLYPLKEDSKSSKRTYKLNERKWNDQECTEWNELTILCENNTNSSKGSNHFIRIDRVSGVVKEDHIVMENGIIFSSCFEGNCTPSKQPKFNYKNL